MKSANIFMGICATIVSSCAFASQTKIIAQISDSYSNIIPSSYNVKQRDEIICLALTGYHETNGAPKDENKKVMFAIKNLAKARTINKTICGALISERIIKDRKYYQFDFIYKKVSIVPKNKEVWKQQILNAIEVYNSNFDTINGACYFHATRLKNRPYWAKKMVAAKITPYHIYYKEKNPNEWCKESMWDIKTPDIRTYKK